MKIGGVMKTSGELARNVWSKTPMWMILTVFVSTFIMNSVDSLTVICSHTNETSHEKTYSIHIVPSNLNFGGYETYNTILPDSRITRDVIVYWEGIDKADNCVGDQLYKYKIYRAYMTADGQLLEVPSNYSYANFAVFSGLSTDMGYTFIAYLTNGANLSSSYTELYVPKDFNDFKPSKPVSLTKTKFVDSPGVYELTWESQLPQYEIASHFLVYWCVVEDSAPNQCNGEMNATAVTIWKSRVNVTVQDPTKNYQFAISTNSPMMEVRNHKNIKHFTHISGGMLWETCEELPANYLQHSIGKITKFWATDIGSRHVGLRWKMDCIDKTYIVKGYQIYYCSVNLVDDVKCSGPNLFKYVEDTIKVMHVPTVFINNLEPSTTYKITIEVLIHIDGLYGIGMRTNQRYFTTYPKEVPSKKNP